MQADSERKYRKSKMDLDGGAKDSTDITQGCDDGNRWRGRRNGGHMMGKSGQVAVKPESWTARTPVHRAQGGDWIISLGLGAV